MRTHEIGGGCRVLSALGKASVLIALFAFMSESVMADSFRCGRSLVRDGDSPADLLDACGEPRYKDSARSVVTLKGVTREVTVKRWHYRHNSRSRPRRVLIYRGEIVGIEIGDD